MGSKIQRIVINKQGAGLTAAGQPILRTAGGQQIIVVTTAGGVRTVQHINSQAGAGGKTVPLSVFNMMSPILALKCLATSEQSETSIMS